MKAKERIAQLEKENAELREQLARALAQIAQLVGPVSYTHLTLPTILRV